MKNGSGGVLVFCAHPDDHIIGAGGTIAKYSSEGKRVIVVIATMGEGSHIWLKESVVKRLRKKETEEAACIAGEHKDIFLGIKESSFSEDIKSQKVVKKIKQLMKSYRIKKIFTHSIDDPHPHHAALVRFVLELTKNMDTVEVFSFNVWNPFNIRKTNAPKMFVDISNTFSQKIQAIRAFRSQRLRIPFWFGSFLPIWVNATLNGLKNHTRYAEEFLKIK